MNSTPPDAARFSSRPVWQNVLGASLTIAAVAYLVNLVATDFLSFSSALKNQTPVSLSAAVTAAIIMFAIKAGYHTTLCQRLSRKTQLFADVLPAFAVAQVIRYLPGKIWGVVYQSGRLSSRLHPSVVIAANTSQMLMTNLLGAGVIVSVLCCAYFDSPWPLIGLLVFIAITELLHRYPKIEVWLLQTIARTLRRNVSAPSVPAQKFWGTIMLSLEWFVYYLIWSAILGEGIPSNPIVVIATWYAAASLLAIFAIAVPAGIAVREALFVSMAATTISNSGELVGYAALMRAILTLSEIVFVPIAYLASKVIRRSLGQAT